MPSDRHLLSVTDLNAQETGTLIERALQMKGPDQGGTASVLSGKSVALLFEKPSLRTKVSFMVGIQEMGGYSFYLGPDEVGLGTREPVSDVARVLSGYVDCIVARVDSHRSLEELAEYGTVPVINALSDWEHPCQIMADLLTVAEHQGDLAGRKLAFIGDGNNVARSLCLALPTVGMDFSIASPLGYMLERETLQKAREIGGRQEGIESLRNPVDAVKEADVVYTDVWTSMGDEAERYARLEAFQGYTVDPELMRQAKPTASLMHDMPAHYGEEVPPGMLEHPQSVAYVQAHNRKHAQKAVLEFLLSQ
ncbi:MAG: ornithine carbamoyltransferase [Chloroflexota bacterium]|nr:ornithine carbamoyltransferase [Chloroflexota bacterium]